MLTMSKSRFGNTRNAGGRWARLMLMAGILQLGVVSSTPVARAWDVDESPPMVTEAEPDSAIILAQTDDPEEPMKSRPLEPRYEPFEPEKKSWYNSGYLFGMTRGVADSTIAPAGKVPLFFLTVPLDIVFLPFAAIGGLFG